MAKSKIKTIDFKSEWNNPKGGVVYYHHIEFDNGDNGQIGTKEKDSLKVGQEIEYTVEATDKGNKIKRVQNTFQKAYGKAQDNQEYQNGIAVGHAINNAVLLVCYDKIDIKNLRSTAELILKHAIEMKEALNK